MFEESTEPDGGKCDFANLEPPKVIRVTEIPDFEAKSSLNGRLQEHPEVEKSVCHENLKI